MMGENFLKAGTALCTTTCALFGLTSSVWADPPKNFSGWDLVFEDNFDGNSLDKSKWNPTYNWGHTHNHRAYCVEENIIVSDGILKLKAEAKKHPDAPATAKFNGGDVPVDYTSAAIDTRGHFEVKYGYIEGRFKAPWQAGTWPAFWTLQDGWPPEIDILEIPASRKQHHYYLHYTNPSWYNDHGSAWDHEASFGGHKDDDVDRSADFHTYAVEWDESNLNFYFDDRKFASFNRPTEIRQLDAQYIIMNLAVGAWAGDNIEITADKPAYFEADWIRVWKAKPVKPDTVVVKNEQFGTCMVPGEDKRLYLKDCGDKGALAVMTQLSSSTFRLDFGDMSLEIPNENKDPGVTAGVYAWNGKDHQKIIFENQYDNQYRLKMVHSGHYLRSTSDGERVVQDWSTSWEWNQRWRIIKASELKEEPREEIPQEPEIENPEDSGKDDETEILMQRFDNPVVQNKNLVYRKNGMLFVKQILNGKSRTYDFRGRLISR